MINKKEGQTNITKEQNDIRTIVTRDVIALSRSYDLQHGIYDTDIDKALKLIKALDPTGRPCTPCGGDKVICKGRNGVIYRNGHLESAPCKEAYSNVCTEPYVPFVFINESGIYCDTSGGYWKTVKDPKAFEYKGVADKQFKTWGHCGPCCNGAFNFTARVNCWEYVSDGIY